MNTYLRVLAKVLRPWTIPSFSPWPFPPSRLAVLGRPPMPAATSPSLSSPGDSTGLTGQPGSARQTLVRTSKAPGATSHPCAAIGSTQPHGYWRGRLPRSRQPPRRLPGLVRNLETRASSRNHTKGVLQDPLLVFSGAVLKGRLSIVVGQLIASTLPGSRAGLSHRRLSGLSDRHQVTPRLRKGTWGRPSFQTREGIKPPPNPVPCPRRAGPRIARGCRSAAVVHLQAVDVRLPALKA